jgi:hypothetical protein
MINEFWKFYRTYKLKEFILNNFERIYYEIDCIDSTSNKTLQMLDAAFLWNITNWSDEDKRKYKQRYYSEGILNYHIQQKNWNDYQNRKGNYCRNLPDGIKNHIINLLNKKNNSSFTLITRKNKKGNEEVGEYLKNNQLKISDLIPNDSSESYMDNVKQIINSLAKQYKSEIELDHVLNRSTTKSIIENLCQVLNSKKENDEIKGRENIINLINERIDKILPFMFGCVVTKQENIDLSQKENEKLKSVHSISIDNDKLWSTYIETKISVYDFNDQAKILNLKNDIHNYSSTYNTISIGYESYTWENDSWGKNNS